MMSWREERDALIAQTLAFVQSVTGKHADFSDLPAPAVCATASASPIVLAVPTSAEQPVETGSNPDPAAAEPSAPAAQVRASGAVSGEPEAPRVESITGRPFTSITSQLGLQRDMQAEIRSRVAAFRANQERFNRERQEYFSSTLQKLRASMDDVRHSDK